MQFLKAHYEKIILSVVLLGLAAAAALMPMRVSKERENEENRRTILLPPKVKELQPVDLTTNAAAISRLEKPPRIELAGDHNLFNPVRWQKRQDGGVIKGTDAGINALRVTNIVSLRLKLDYEEVGGTPDNQSYQISVLNEAQSPRPTPRIARVKQKNNVFTLQEVKGDPANPASLELLLEGEKNPISISKGKPFERIVGYAADFRYDPENRTWKNQKKDDEISFAGETYKVVAITANEVVLSAKSNKKQTSKEYQPVSK
jgi:hypothetical protein